MKKNVNQKKQNFVLGALILMISGILCKVIGACFKVPLTNMIGDDGMGYFNSAYSIYTVLFTISTAGIPVAVSRIISSYIVKKDALAVKRTFSMSLFILVVLGAISSLGMFLFADKLASDVIKNPEAVYAIKALAPTLLFICIESSLRGYFQGHQNMTPTSVSQIIESFGKLIIGIVSASFAMSKGYALPIVSAYAILGIGIGAAGSCIYLLVCKIAYKKFDYGIMDISEKSPSAKQILIEIAVIAIPITLSSLVLSISNLVDSTVIMRCLQNSGLTLDAARNLLAANPEYALETMTDADILAKGSNFLYGNYTSLAVTYFNLPLVLLTPLSVSVIPVLSEAFTKSDKEQIGGIVTSAFRIQSAVSLPCAMGLCVLAEPALEVLFKRSSAERAAPLLSILAISIFFVAMTSVTNAVLQSLHKQWLPIISMAAGVAAKFASAFILISIPEVNIYGAPISTAICYLVAMLTNFFFMSKYTHCLPGIRKVFLKPVLSAFACAVAALGSYKILEAIIGKGRVITLAAIVVAALVYVVVLFVIGALEKPDILLLPKGEKIYSLLKKAKLVKR